MKNRKEDYSEKYSDRSGFADWFTNVFWYHYKWPVLVCVAVAALVVFLAIDTMNKVTYDARVVFASSDPYSESAFTEIKQVLEEAVGDVDGNGTAEIELVILSLGDDELGISNRERVFLLMNDAQYALYIFDNDTGSAYWIPELEYFENLNDYGFTGDENNALKMNLSKNELFVRANIQNMSLCLIDHSSVSGKDEDKQTLDLAMRMINALLEYQ